MRRGPRPLLLHLTLAMLKSTASVLASQSSNAGSPPWSGVPGSEKLAEKLRQAAGVLATGGIPGAGLVEALGPGRGLIPGVTAHRRPPLQGGTAQAPGGSAAGAI